MTPDIKYTAQETSFQKVAECLYRNKSSGRYYAFVKRGRKQYRRSLKTDDRKIAERALADFRRQIAQLSHTTSASQMTFRGLANRWLDTLRPHLKPSSFRRRETSVTQLCNVMGSLTLRQISPRVCTEWANKRGQGLEASTYNNERDTLKLVLEYAKTEGLLLDNPARALPRRKLPRHSLLIPSHADFRRLVETLHTMGDRCTEAAALVELLAYSGMRLAEATNMTWCDVDFDAKRFTVTGGELGTKNHEARSVPLFPALETFLTNLRETHPATPSPNEFVIAIGTARKAVENACKKAKLPPLTHHTLRHYFVSNAIEAGIDFKTIAAWVGHKDGGLLVAKTYGHLRDTHSQEMAKRMTFSANTGAV